MAPQRKLGSDGDVGTVMQFGISIVLFTLLGNWLDGKLGSSPVFLLVGLVIGGAAGFFAMYRKLTAGERQGAPGTAKSKEGAGNGEGGSK